MKISYDLTKMLTFCQKGDSWFAGQRRNHEKLIQAPSLTQNLKKFQTRWVITIIVMIVIIGIITISSPSP